MASLGQARTRPAATAIGWPTGSHYHVRVGSPAPQIRRRTVVQAAVWSVPAISLASATPAFAGSLSTVRLSLVTALGSAGYDLRLRDGKFNNPASANTNPDNTQAVTAQFRVSDQSTGLPIAGASLTFDPGTLTDGEGNYLLAFYPTSTSGTLAESSTRHSVSVVSDANGWVWLKIATATYSKDSCAPGEVGPYSPVPGVFTVQVTATGHEPAVIGFTFLVFDGASTVTCP